MKHASRTNAAPLLLSLILSAPLTTTLTISAENKPSVVNQVIAAIASTTESTSETPAPSAEQNAELAFINTTVNKTIVHIDNVRNAFDTFLSRKDKRTYDVHVDEMHALIDAIVADIYVPAQQMALETPSNKMYQISWHIISELCEGLQQIHRVLHRHRPTKNVLNVGNDLKGATAELQVRCTKLPAHIDELIALIGKQDLELKGKLLALRIKLNQLLTSNGGNSFAILESLRFRKNCK